MPAPREDTKARKRILMNQILRLMEEKGQSDEDVAKQLGIAPVTVARLRSGGPVGASMERLYAAIVWLKDQEGPEPQSEPETPAPAPSEGLTVNGGFTFTIEISALSDRDLMRLWNLAQKEVDRRTT